MLGLAMVGASSGPPDSTTRTCAPDADKPAARTEPAAPAPTTMKSYRFSSFDRLVIVSPQDWKSYFPASDLNLFPRGIAVKPCGAPGLERACSAVAVLEKL